MAIMTRLGLSIIISALLLVIFFMSFFMENTGNFNIYPFYIAVIFFIIHIVFKYALLYSLEKKGVKVSTWLTKGMGYDVRLYFKADKSIKSCGIKIQFILSVLTLIIALMSIIVGLFLNKSWV